MWRPFSIPEIAKAARGFDNCIIDGEICAIGKDGLTDFAALQAAMKGDKTDKLILFAFDLLFRGDEDVCGYPLIARKTFLRELLEAHADQKVIRFHDHLDATGQDVIDIACNMKLEGIISKRLSEPYVSGRTGIRTKAKCRKEQHAVVGGWTESDEGFAGLLLGVYQGKNLIPIGRVGTGFPRKLVDWLEPRLKQLEISQSPFAGNIPSKSGRKIHWAKPGARRRDRAHKLDQRRSSTPGVVQGSLRAQRQEAPAGLDQFAGGIGLTWRGVLPIGAAQHRFGSS